MSDELKRCPCCGSEARKVNLMFDNEISHHDGATCSKKECCMYQPFHLHDWQSRPLEDALKEDADYWGNIATVLSVKLMHAMEALKGISSLWHGRGLSPKVLEELDRTIAEIEGE